MGNMSMMRRCDELSHAAIRSRDGVSMRVSVWPGLLSLLIGSACGGEPTGAALDAECDPNLEPARSDEVVVGLMAEDGSTFLPLSDGMVLPIVRGNQGGYHVELAVRFFDTAARTWQHDFDLYRDDGSRANVGGSTRRVDACGSAWTVTSGIRVFYTGPLQGDAPLPVELALRCEPVEGGAPVTAPTFHVQLAHP